jgi:hypothetical protein
VENPVPTCQVGNGAETTSKISNHEHKPDRYAIKHNAATAEEFCRCASAAVRVGIGDSARQHVALQLCTPAPLDLVFRSAFSTEVIVG